MSNQSSNAENQSAVKNSPSADTVSGSAAVKTAVFSSSDPKTAEDQGSSTEQISLSEKTRLGFVSDDDANPHLVLGNKAGTNATLSDNKTSTKETLSDSTKPENNSVPVRSSISQEQIQSSAGALLQYTRERLGYTRNEVARALKVRVTTVYDLESDRLAQETAVKFTTQLLDSYARFLRLDPETVINLYMQKVTSMVKITQETIERKSESHVGRNLFLIVLFAAAAGGAYFIFGGDNSSSTIASNESSVSGELNTSGQDFKLEEENSQTVVLEDSGNGTSGEITLSENTVKAQNQAQALQTSLTEETKVSDEHAVSALPLNNEIVERRKAESNSAIKLATSQQNQASLKDNTSKDVLNSKSDTTDKTSTTDAKKSDKTAGKDSLADNKAKSEDTAKSADNAKSEEKADSDKAKSTPSLDKKLSDISDKVKIVDREDSIPSLNKVEITVIKDVALEVKDASKVIKSGVFKPGDIISLTSIPPFVISVSDTSAIRVNYLDGVVQTPNRKQVTFKLPSH